MLGYHKDCYGLDNKSKLFVKEQPKQVAIPG